MLICWLCLIVHMFDHTDTVTAPPGRPRTMWMKTIQQDLKSKNLSLNEAINPLKPTVAIWV